MEVVRREIDSPNVQLTQALSTVLQWNLPLSQMQHLADLDVLIRKYKNDYDKLKKSKLAAMGGTFTDKGIPQFEDNEAEKAGKFTIEILEYFEGTEELDFSIITITANEDIQKKLNGAIMSGLKDFVKFTESKA